MTALLKPSEFVSVSPGGAVYPIPGKQEVESAFEQLARRSQSFRREGGATVVVQGLGFVGAAVAAAIAGARDDAGRPRYFVIGLDLATPSAYWKIGCINDGISPVISPDAKLPALIKEGACIQKNLCATSCERAYGLADVIVVDMPLSVKDRADFDGEEISIDLDPFREGIRSIGLFMKPDALVVVETTVPAGATRKVVLPLLEAERTRRGIKEPVLLAHAYERVMPGPNYVDSINRIRRTYSGVDEASARRAEQFLASFVEVELHPLTRLAETDESELAKLLENSYRAMNIAFIHEWTLLAERAGIDLFSVIESIRLRKGTHDNMRFPGFGVGGYCLTKDSLLAQWSARHLLQADVELQMTLEALRVNYLMPLHTLELACELVGTDISGKTFLICGICYAPDVGDTRNSPAELLADRLIAKGGRVRVHDPCVRQWPERPELSVQSELADCILGVDCVIFAVAHPCYRKSDASLLTERAGKPLALVDATNCISDEQADQLHRTGWRILGVGKGHWRKRGYQCQ
jgi:UDP-N-acetyl-D-glucosamine dehydrogenase